MSAAAAPEPAWVTAPACFFATRRLVWAEHLRFPCQVGAVHEDRWPAWTEVLTNGSLALLWPAELPGDPPVLATLLPADGSRIPICARVLSDGAVAERLGGQAGSWRPVLPVLAEDGRTLGSIWRDDSGSVLLPFDPDEAIRNFWSERYMNRVERNGRGPVARAMLHSYYRVRGAVPRRAQIWIRRRYARVQARTPFPRWPLETALHDFLELLGAMLAELAGQPVPYLAPWPDGHRWALVLTHDVETRAGLRAMGPILTVERALGLRSAWNFVPRRYSVPDSLVAELVSDHFEVGVHGLYHDGRDLSSLSRLRSRLPAMHEAARRWQAVGFRSPASHRHWDWMPMLGFDYDSSYPDTDPFEPQRGGCLSWWPFFNQDMVELPLTMPHDHTLFVILAHRDEAMWVHKAEALRGRGGMALIVTHPDYLGNAAALPSYRRLLERYARDETAWKPLPRELSAWWRQRAASTIVPGPEGWAVDGPAGHRARIELMEARPWC